MGGAEELANVDSERSSIAAVDPALLSRYTGSYQIAPDRIAVLGPLDELDHMLLYVDLKTLRTGALHPRSATELFAGPTVLGTRPVAFELSFEPDERGEVDGVWWKDADAARVFARRVSPARAEPVAFQSAAVTLAGVLYLPPGAGPHPAIVCAHGSGAATRENGPFAPFLAQAGFAVLSFDKRGTGASSGDWQAASFDDLADDLLAGVAYLRSRADVDPTRLGIWAISQGGWVASLAAARSPDVRFLIVHAGSGVSVAENVVYEMEGFMRAAGLSEPDVQNGLAYARRLTELASDGAPYASVRARFAEADGEPWAPFVYLHDAAKDDYQWAWYRMNGRVDPARILPRVSCPVLWFLGERDRLVDARASEPRLRAALAGNPDATVRVLAGANHPLMECESGYQEEIPQLERFVPGYFNGMVEWLEARGFTTPESGRSIPPSPVTRSAP